jgi:hypothetical protein
MKKKKSVFSITLTNEDGTPFILPTCTLSEAMEEAKNLNEKFLRNNEERKQLTEWFSEVFREGTLSTIADFNLQFTSLKEYLISQKNILPADVYEFISWFIIVRHGNRDIINFMGKWPKIEPADFGKFHKYKEALYKNGGGLASFHKSFYDYHAKPEDVVEKPVNLVKKESKNHTLILFEDLFKKPETAQKIVNISISVGLTNETGDFLPGGRKIWLIIAIWAAIQRLQLSRHDVKTFTACQSFAQKLGCELKYGTFQDNWQPKIINYPGKRGVEFYTEFVRHLTKEFKPS